VEVIYIACPGQGSQTPGFLEPWLEIDVFKKSIEKASAILDLDLIHFGTAANAEQIRDTQIAQPLIVASSIASFETLTAHTRARLTYSGVAGHSVGEIAAAHIAGVLDFESALRFVSLRGKQMAKAAALSPSSMAAVVGGEPADILTQLDSAGLYAANYNGPGQIVAAGSKQLIDDLVANPPKGTRVVGLAVAGAFHTKFMESAQQALASFAADIAAKDPTVSLWTNSDGSVVANGQKFLDLLVDQVSKPVRWDKTMESMQTSGIKALIELLPGGTLAGISKRAMKDVEAVALKTPADLDKVADLLERQS
jgi:[acyl-carrier-protein] S-malonyltransferase